MGPGTRRDHMSRTRTIAATFGGASATFCIPDGPRTEAVLIGPLSPFRLYQSLASGDWSPFDVRFILTFAFGGRGAVYSPEVNAVMRRSAPGVYAPLAAKILEAYLFGIPATDAEFDERTAIGDPA